MRKCSCGRPLDKVPNWLQGVKVDFICHNCPDRDLQSIADIKLELPEGQEAEKPKKSATKK